MKLATQFNAVLAIIFSVVLILAAGLMYFVLERNAE